MATKTINLTGAEVAVTGLDGAHAHNATFMALAMMSLK